MSYDDNNIFAKILRGEIPNETVYEDDHALAFHDIHPHAPVHVLVIPKGAYTDIHDFTARADEAEIIGYYRAFPRVIEKLGLDRGGFRVISNCGENGGQEVPHFHSHILGGAYLGPIMSEQFI